MVKTNFRETVRYFLEGKLSSEKELELLEWIHSDESVREQFLAEQKSLASSVAGIKDKELSFQWNRLKSRIISGNRKISGRREIIRWTAIAAAFLLGGLFTAAFLFGLFETPRQNIATHTVTVPFGAKSNFTLPDGTNVWLNSGSTFTYPSAFDSERRVTLTGEAYFEVTRDDRTFTIVTQFGNIQVLGTSFNVEAYPDDPLFETTLVEGSVKVTRNEAEVVLKPGQMAYNSGDGLKVKEVNTELYTSWKEGKLIFVREPFPDLMKKLEHWFNVKIDFADSNLSKVWYTGTIEMETITEVMEMVSKAARVSYSFDSKKRVITIKTPK